MAELTKNIEKKSPTSEEKKTTSLSELLITNSAKDFLKNSNQSSNYLQAVNLTVSTIMAALEAKIEKNVKESTSKERSKTGS